MKTLKIILGAIIIAMFAALGIQNVFESGNGVKLKQMDFQTIDSKLNENKIQLDTLSNKLNQEKQQNTQSVDQIKALEKTKEDLEKQKADLESKVEAKAEEKQRLADVAKATLETATGSTPVAAASGDCASWLSQAGITDVGSAMFIINHESGCNPCKVNGGAVICGYEGSRAYGIGQALPSSKMSAYGSDYLTNPVTQLKWMQSYVIGRYGSWANAVAFWNVNRYY